MVAELARVQDPQKRLKSGDVSYESFTDPQTPAIAIVVAANHIRHHFQGGQDFGSRQTGEDFADDDYEDRIDQVFPGRGRCKTLGSAVTGVVRPAAGPDSSHEPEASARDSPGGVAGTKGEGTADVANTTDRN